MVTLVGILSVFIYLTTLQSAKAESVPVSIIKDTFTKESNFTIDSPLKPNNNDSLLKVQNQTLNGTQNVNVTLADKTVLNQTYSAGENQTMSAINRINNTSTNATNAEIPKKYHRMTGIQVLGRNYLRRSNRNHFCNR